MWNVTSQPFSPTPFNSVLGRKVKCEKFSCSACQQIYQFIKFKCKNPCISHLNVQFIHYRNIFLFSYAIKYAIECSPRATVWPNCHNWHSLLFTQCNVISSIKGSECHTNPYCTKLVCFYLFAPDEYRCCVDFKSTK